MLDLAVEATTTTRVSLNCSFKWTILTITVWVNVKFGIDIYVFSILLWLNIWKTNGVFTVVIKRKSLCWCTTIVKSSLTELLKQFGSGFSVCMKRKTVQMACISNNACIVYDEWKDLRINQQVNSHVRSSNVIMTQTGVTRLWQIPKEPICPQPPQKDTKKPT